MKTLRYFIEYVSLRSALFLLDCISLPTAEFMALRLAGIWFKVDGRRRRISEQNILRSGITADQAEATRIARDSFRHFAVLVVESLKSGESLSEQNWRERVEVCISPATMALLEKPGQAVILVSGHIGNWEISAQMVSYIKPVVGITRDMNNPYTDKLIKKRKPKNRFTLTPKHDAGLDRLLSILKNGEILALLTDQHASGRGMMIDFFGTPASTHTSPALLHLVTHVPLCFGYCLRTGPMSFKLIALDPIIHKPTGNKEQDIRAILERLNRELESAIRQAPEQYLWAHRRWRDMPNE
jgi:Kdo2-lipid IVA lauroyltransferase/acyltransferase